LPHTVTPLFGALVVLHDLLLEVGHPINRSNDSSAASNHL
jgi:hypothetical protein